MGIFLNTSAPFEAFKPIASGRYFVDKSLLIAELIPALGQDGRYFCITRPFHFGKSVLANMVGAFFGPATDGSGIFDKLQIAKAGNYREHLHKHNLIYIDFSRIPKKCTSYRQYIGRIQDGISRDLAEAYPEFDMDVTGAVWDILQAIFEKTRHKFIFVIDAWDAVFHKSFVSMEDQKNHLEFLKNLLKGQVFIELVYMTGILPIAKYSDVSGLNMFAEYNMSTSERFSEYFGFLDNEVDALYETYQRTTERCKITREDLRVWYNGYHTAAGDRIYNPRSVICALTDNQLKNYWVSPGTYGSILGYIKDNVDNVRDDLALMFAGESIPLDIQEYAAASMQLETKDEIYSAMVVYGFLAYEDGYVSIPNKELMDSCAAMVVED